MFHVPEKFRVVDGPLATEPSSGDYGLFMLKLKGGQTVRAVVGSGFGWEHVSVSRRDRCPLWDEMCQVKDLFWDAGDAVIQFHPPRSQYVNYHPHCLHLWRPIGRAIELPPSDMVGPQGAKFTKGPTP